MGDLKKSYVPREAVRKVENAALKTFLDFNKRNPTAQEKKKLIQGIHGEAHKLNRG